MAKKSFIILFFLIGGLTFQNCSNCDCCFGDIPEYFDIQDIEIQHLNLDYSRLDSTDIAFNEYGFLRLTFLVNYIVQHQQLHHSFSMITAAYGCTPPEPGELGSKEEAIELLEILTVNDYNENLKAGDSINGIMSITDLDNSPSPYLLSDYLIELDANIPQERFTFKLTEQPTFDKPFQVMVKLSLSTGEEYEILSSIINFN